MGYRKEIRLLWPLLSYLLTSLWVTLATAQQSLEEELLLLDVVQGVIQQNAGLSAHDQK